MRHIYLLILALCLYPSLSLSLEPKYEAYREILTNYLVSSEKNNVSTSLVDYKNLKESKLIYDAVLEVVNFDISLLESQDEEIAFYINVYNIHILDLASKNWPISSIKDLSKWNKPIWKKKIVKLNGSKLSLDELEQLLIQQYNEPRIHFALNCASISCPDLMAAPYTGKKLNEQLEHQAILFFNNKTKGVLIVNNTLNISKIFKWYKEDFSGDSSFMKMGNAILNTDLTKYEQVNYLPYDWSINAQMHK